MNRERRSGCVNISVTETETSSEQQKTIITGWFNTIETTNQTSSSSSFFPMFPSSFCVTVNLTSQPCSVHESLSVCLSVSDLPSSPEQMKPSFSCHNDSVRHKQRQVTLWVTMATPPGKPIYMHSYI